MRSLKIGLLALAMFVTACSSEVAEAPAARDDIDATSEEAADQTVDNTEVDDTIAPVEALDPVAVQATFDEWAEAADGGGVAAVRRGNSELISLAAGEDPQTGAPLNPDDPVRVGSISKSFTAVMVMQMVEAGDVDLDAPISTYLADLEIGSDPTVRQLLGHRTGIPNYTEKQGFFIVVLADADRALTPTDVIAFTNGESDFEPGSDFYYSNTNYIILGLLIEAVSGMSLNEVLAAQITEPLGLVNTTFDDGTVETAGGYSAMMPSGNSFEQGYTAIATSAWAAGSLVSTAEELAVFYDALILGDLLDEALVAEMIAELDAGAEYGLGMTPGPHFGVGHGGAIIGFNSIVEIDPETGDLVVVVVNNDMRRPDVAVNKLADVVLADS